MAEPELDLDAYFRRISYAGSRAPTLDTLRALQWAHVSTIPFENLDVILKRPIRLDAASLQRKLVADRRGGYCFESNGLFMYALRALGFRVTALGARVLWAREDPALPGREHMLLRIDLPEGAFVADVAFGGMTPTLPLKLEAGTEQPSRHEPYRLHAAEDGDLDLQAYMRDDDDAGARQWRTLYRLSLQPHLPVDYEHANWYVSTHPGSFFTRSLIAAIPAESCRYTLFEREFRTRWPDGRVETRVMADVGELTQVLERQFSLSTSPADKDPLKAQFPA